VTRGAICLSTSSRFVAIDGKLFESDVAAGPRQARHKSLGDQILAAHEQDRYGGGRSLKRRYHHPVGEDDIGLQSNQFPGVGAHAPDVAAGESIFDVDIAALDPTQFPEPRGELVSELSFNCVIGVIRDCADQTDTLAPLLRPRGERPYRCAPEPPSR
jgi:hypothetical protein